MYRGEPTPESSVCSAATYCAAPKSLIFSSSFLPSSRLAGLMSQWITPCWCAWFSARQAMNMSSTNAVDRQQAVVAAVFLEGPPARVLHDDVVRIPLADRVMDRDDMRVLELAGKGGFGEERALRQPPLPVTQDRTSLLYLDRHLLRPEHVVSEIYPAGRALPEGTYQRILADTPGNRAVHVFLSGKYWNVLASRGLLTSTRARARAFPLPAGGAGRASRARGAGGWRLRARTASGRRARGLPPC